MYTAKFWLLCASSFFFSTSFNMLIPELPLFLTGLGGSEYKGYIIGLFTITAGLSRPFSGRLTDTVGRVPVMLIGSLVCVVCSLLYPLLTTVSGFLLLRLIHGFSTGFKPTATAAYLADIIPATRWGEAMGLHGLCFSTGLAIGPALGSLITANYTIEWLFYCSSLFALLSMGILLKIKETHTAKQGFSLSLLKLSKEDYFEPLVLPAAIVTFLGYLSYGALLTIIPDWGTHLGIENRGTFYVLFTLSSLAVRIVAGKLADQKGRVFVLQLGLAAIVCGVVVIGAARSVTTLFVGSLIYGLGTGLFSPATSAWTADLSSIEHRGRGMATMYIALEAGIGIGAFIAGWIFGDNLSAVPFILYGFALMQVVALFYLGFKYKPMFQKRRKLL
jgi:MFS family permease